MAFLAPLLGAVAGPLLGGLFGGHAAQPAAQSETAASQATANMVNMLSDAYKNTFLPAQTSALNTYQQTAGSIPFQNVVQSQILQDLLPTYMPDILRAREQFSIQQGVDNTVNALQTELTQRGITGPAAEAILGHVREQGLQSQAQLASNIGAWEAGQTLQNRRNAFTDVMGVQALPAEYAANVGKNIPGQVIGGGMDLAKLFGGAAAGAAAPWMQAGQNLGKAAANYFATPQTPSDYAPGGSTGVTPDYGVTGLPNPDLASGPGGAGTSGYYGGVYSP